MASESTITESTVRDALAQVKDPDIGMPLTDLGMVKSVAVDALMFRRRFISPSPVAP